MNKNSSASCFSLQEKRSTSEKCHGLTIVEMLVSLALTMILLFAIVQMFGMLGDTVGLGRATIEMSAQMRSSLDRLQKDLNMVTVDTLPWAKPGAGGGYFEYIEGPQVDPASLNPQSQVDGDLDDVLAFTVASQGEPFVATVTYLDAAGKPVTEVLSSQVAEIIWFVRNHTLHRIVRPLVAGKTPSLEELTDRKNRFVHRANFPHEMNMAALVPNTGAALGEDIALTSVLSFDVRAYDPKVELHNGKHQDAAKGISYGALVPGDARSAGDVTYAKAPPYNPRRFGGYVNLGHGVGPSDFAGPPAPLSKLTVPTYDTWPYLYEKDGIDQDGDKSVDEGTDGIDDVITGVKGIVDDPEERETSPPYPVPLRGISICVRVIERSTKRVRQQTVAASFVPD